MKKKLDKSVYGWACIITVITFFLSLFFSFLSTTAISKLNLLPSVIILFLVIFMGIIFDLIGVAVTVAEEKDFHAKASKKIKGAKTGLKLIKHSSKVSNFCADVIGDICGVLSGAISALIALKLTENYGMGSNLQFIISALVASLTIGGKAFSKDIAKNNSTKIISIISTIIPF